MNKDISHLTLAIRRFFKSLHADEDTLKLAEQIQTALELGHTAIDNHETIKKNNLISKDGSSGYIVQQKGLSGFRRFYNQEMFIKQSFLNAEFNPDFSPTQVATAINQVTSIINYQSMDAIDLQWQASISFLTSSRFILNGGPGTGKTTTVVRMLLLYFILNPNNKVALTAPTGKAANRMLQSLITMLESFSDIPDDLKQRLNLEAKTLHRLLGYNPKTNQLKYNESKHLPYDLVIVDEASMLDVSMTHGLLKALKPEAQLLLIGDKNQLPAVDAGNVFADLCALSKTENQTSNLYKHYSKSNIVLTNNLHYIELLKNYRFEKGSAVVLLCEAIKNKDNDQLQKLKQDAIINWQDPKTKNEKTAALNSWYQSHNTKESAMILSPINNGTNSVEELNSLAIQILHHNNHSIMQENMPVLITQNDYTLNVFNGDIGHLKFTNNQWHITFDDFNQQRLILASAIKHWKPAYAISIHKSQGSEYDHVLIALPDDENLEILSNQLIYTAASRAKKSVTLWTSDKVMKITIQRDERRVTFLNSSN